MADNAHHAHGESSTSSGGTMDISDHVKTWLAFWTATKYSVVGLLLLAALLAFFRTHNGY